MLINSLETKFRLTYIDGEESGKVVGPVPSRVDHLTFNLCLVMAEHRSGQDSIVFYNDQIPVT